SDTPEEKEFKTLVNTLLPDYITKRMSEDPEMNKLYEKANEFITNLDRPGASALRLSLVSFAEAEAEKFVAVMLRKQAATEAARTQSRSTAPPATVLPGASAQQPKTPAKSPVKTPVNQPINQGEDDDDDWNVTDNDLRTIIR
ncbi:MAG TPA: hypothetical protein VF692_05520, partial [Pyrinomonadaceae bacterium]